MFIVLFIMALGCCLAMILFNDTDGLIDNRPFLEAERQRMRAERQNKKRPLIEQKLSAWREYSNENRI